MSDGYHEFLSNVVDIFNVTAGTWTTAALSEARLNLAATSLPNAGLTICSGGQSTLNNELFLEHGHVFMIFSVGHVSFSSIVDIFNVTAGTWTTAALSEARYALSATSLPNAGLAIFAGGSKSTFINFSDLDRDRGFV